MTNYGPRARVATQGLAFGVAPRYLLNYLDLESSRPWSARLEAKGSPDYPYFPLCLWHNGRQIEVCGLLSSPQIARSCLTEERAMDLVGFDAAEYGLQGDELAQDQTPGYFRYEPAIKQALLDLLNLEHRPLGLRLRALSEFAKEADRVLADKDCSDADLLGLIQPLSLERYLSLGPGLDWGRPGGQERAMSILRLSLEQLLKSAPESSLAKRLNECQACYAAVDELNCMLRDKGQAERVPGAYALRRAALPAEATRRLEALFSRMLKNVVLSIPYTTAPSLGRYVQDLDLRLVLVWLVLISRPAVDELLQARSQAAWAWSLAGLEQAAVDTVCQVAQVFELRPWVLDELSVYLRYQGLGHESWTTGFCAVS